MRLKPPCRSHDFRAKDIYGERFQLSKLQGKRVMLSFFRDADCPFCNYRLYELTQKYDEWKEAGLEIVVMFTDRKDQVLASVAKRPRPFTMICDPKLGLYEKYGVEKSASALVKAIVFNGGEIIRGFKQGARPTNNPHITVVPADFLIDVDGSVVDVWYGKDTADHIPMQRLKKFASMENIKAADKMQEELAALRQENANLREKVADERKKNR